MPFLSATDSLAVLRRLQPLQQFRGRVPGSRDSVRWLELHPKFNGIELWVFDVDDVGTVDHVDVATFPPTSGHAPSFPVSIQATARDAMVYAQSQFGALADAWNEPGNLSAVYSQFVRAQRPSTWAPDGA